MPLDYPVWLEFRAVLVYWVLLNEPQNLIVSVFQLSHPMRPTIVSSTALGRICSSDGEGDQAWQSTGTWGMGSVGVCPVASPFAHVNPGSVLLSRPHWCRFWCRWGMDGWVLFALSGGGRLAVSTLLLFALSQSVHFLLCQRALGLEWRMGNFL